MKLVFKGKYVNEEQLPRGELPANAVRFIEPETPAELNVKAALFIIPPMILVAAIIILAFTLHANITLGLSWWGVLLAFIAMVPHEMLHAVCFPKDATVQMYYSLKNMMMFVASIAPVSKKRFIWMSFCPNFILGWLPLIIWAVFPNVPVLSDIILPFAAMNIFFGAGDYMNMYNAWRQMPKGSWTQLSGFHSYWFMPAEK